ncbi:sulfate transporter family-domain-containing protein [Entophlyctis helioformis]|nr:sulfate transporter family-domain-containing protein [Entophlyctis helioformis]
MSSTTRKKTLLRTFVTVDNDGSTLPLERHDTFEEKLAKFWEAPVASLQAVNFGHLARACFPIVGELAAYDRAKFFADLGAAITVAFVLIPQSIAYSSLARVEPIKALVSACFPVFVYAVFGSSRQLSLGRARKPASFRSSHGRLDPTLMVGMICLILWVLRAGFVDNILSGYLLTGFVLSVACLIMTEQLPEMLALTLEKVKGPHTELSTLDKLVKSLKALPSASPSGLAVGLVGLAFLITAKYSKLHFAKKRPWVMQIPEILILVVLSIVLSATLDFSSRGIRVLGIFNNRVSAPTAPPINMALIQNLLSSAITISIVGFVESQTVTRNFGLKNGYFPSGDQELFALGAANVVGSMLGAYVTFGSLPRSRILANAGGKTTVSGLMIAAFVFVLFTFLGNVLQYLPKPILAAIVFNAAINLIEFDEIFFVFKVRGWSEILMFLATWAITFFTSISQGILLCLLLAVLIIVRRTSAVDMALLGQLPSKPSSTADVPAHPLCHKHSQDPLGTEITLVDVKEHSSAEVLEGILPLQIRGPLMFYNSGRIRRTIQHLLKTDKKLLKLQANGITDATDIERHLEHSSSEIDLTKLGESETPASLPTHRSGASDEKLDSLEAPAAAAESELTLKNRRSMLPQTGYDTIRRQSQTHLQLKTSGSTASLTASSSTSSYSMATGTGGISTTAGPSTDVSVSGIQPSLTSVSTTTSPATGANPSADPLLTNPRVSRIKQVAVDMTHMSNNSDLNQASIHSISGVNLTVPAGMKTFVLILDFSACIDMDSAALFVLQEIIHSFHDKEHTRVVFTGLHDFQRRLFRISGLLALLGSHNVFDSVSDAIQAVRPAAAVHETRQHERGHEEDRVLPLSALFTPHSDLPAPQPAHH